MLEQILGCAFLITYTKQRLRAYFVGTAAASGHEVWWHNVIPYVVLQTTIMPDALLAGRSAQNAYFCVRVRRM